jgi:cytochrome b561
MSNLEKIKQLCFSHRSSSAMTGDFTAPYEPPLILLHWIVAFLIIGLIVLGWYMVGLPKNTEERAFFFNLHKSLGLTTAILIAIRLFWRLTHQVPSLPVSLPLWQRRAAITVHFLLYGCMVLMPLSGYLQSSFSAYPPKFWGLSLPPWGWEDKNLRAVFNNVHATLGYFLVVLIVVHVAATLHHMYRGNRIIVARMLPPLGRIPPGLD